MPSTVMSLFRAAGLVPGEFVQWGTGPATTSPGVYVVSRTADVAELVRDQAADVSMAAINELLETRPELTVDAERPTDAQLRDRIRALWLSDEACLYIGLAGTSAAQRVGAYYETRLGARSPHAGGWPLKTLGNLGTLYVHIAACRDPAAAEAAMLATFCAGVSEGARRVLIDPDRPFPFANLEYPKGTRQRHGIAGARAPRRTVGGRGSVARIPSPRKSASGAPSKGTEGPTLHAAMAQVLSGDEWMDLKALTVRIAEADLYRRGDGAHATQSQIRLRAKNYGTWFELEGPRVRLRNPAA